MFGFFKRREDPFENSRKKLVAKMHRLEAEANAKLDQAARTRSKQKRRILKREAEKLFDRYESAANAWAFLLSR